MPRRKNLPLSNYLAIQRRAPKRCRRAPIHLMEGRREVTVAGKAKLEAEGGEVIVLVDEIERSRESQAQLIAVEWYPFDLLEHLRQIHRRSSAHLGRDFGQRPTPTRLSREHELRPVGEALAMDARSRRPGRPRTHRSSHERQRDTLDLQGLGEALAKAVPQQHDQRLRPRIDAQPLRPKRERSATDEETSRH